MAFGAGKGKPPALELHPSAQTYRPVPPALPCPLSPPLSPQPSRSPWALCCGGVPQPTGSATPQPCLLSHRRARCQDVLKSDPLSQCQDTAEGERQPQPLPGAPGQAASSARGTAMPGMVGGTVLGYQCPPAPSTIDPVLDAPCCPPSLPVTQLPHGVLTPSPVPSPAQGPLPWRSWFLGWRRTQPSSSAWHAPHRRPSGGWCGTARRRAQARYRGQGTVGTRCRGGSVPWD